MLLATGNLNNLLVFDRTSNQEGFRLLSEKDFRGRNVFSSLNTANQNQPGILG